MPYADRLPTPAPIVTGSPAKPSPQAFQSRPVPMKKGCVSGDIEKKLGVIFASFTWPHKAICLNFLVGGMGS
jgi:hypothetical protein